MEACPPVKPEKREGMRDENIESYRESVFRYSASQILDAAKSILVTSAVNRRDTRVLILHRFMRINRDDIQ